jgi:hypothetical protein
MVGDHQQRAQKKSFGSKNEKVSFSFLSSLLFLSFHRKARDKLRRFSFPNFSKFNLGFLGIFGNFFLWLLRA